MLPEELKAAVKFNFFCAISKDVTTCQAAQCSIGLRIRTVDCTFNMLMIGLDDFHIIEIISYSSIKFGERLKSKKSLDRYVLT